MENFQRGSLGILWWQQLDLRSCGNQNHAFSSPSYLNGVAAHFRPSKEPHKSRSSDQPLPGAESPRGCRCGFPQGSRTGRSLQSCYTALITFPAGCTLSCMAGMSYHWWTLNISVTKSALISQHIYFPYCQFTMKKQQRFNLFVLFFFKAEESPAE